MARPTVRERIIDAGFAVFYGKGFHGSSVQDITEAAGVPKGSFYNHFDSKEALGAEIVDRYDRSNTFLPLLSDRSIAPLERLRRYYAGLTAIQLADECRGGCLLGNFSAELADHSAVVRERLSALFAKWTGALEVAVRDGQSDGSIPSDLDAGTLAAALLDAYEGAVLRTRVEKNGRALDRFMKIAFDKLLR